MGRPMPATSVIAAGLNGRDTDPIASDASRHARQALIPDEPIVVAPFGQGRGATPQGGPGEADGPAGRDGWPGPRGGEGACGRRGFGGPSDLGRLRRPRGHACTVAEARRGSAAATWRG